MALCLIRVIIKPALVKVFISQRCCNQPENYTSIRTYNRFGVFSITTKVFKITSSPDGFHQGM